MSISQLVFLIAQQTYNLFGDIIGFCFFLLNVFGVYLYVIQSFGSTASESSFYVKGIISSINEVSALGNKKFESEDQIKIGDVVIMYGQLVNYRDNTPEIIQGYIFSLNGQSDGTPIDFGTGGDGTTR